MTLHLIYPPWGPEPSSLGFNDDCLAVFAVGVAVSPKEASNVTLVSVPLLSAFHPPPSFLLSTFSFSGADGGVECLLDLIFRLWKWVDSRVTFLHQPLP